MGQTHTYDVKIGLLGVGRVAVPFPSSKINLVRVNGWHGTPHVHEDGADTSWIEVLGAVPDSEVSVSFYIEQEV